MRRESFPNHLDFGRTIICRTEIYEVIREGAADLFLYICHRVTLRKYLDVP